MAKVSNILFSLLLMLSFGMLINGAYALESSAQSTDLSSFFKEFFARITGYAVALSGDQSGLVAYWNLDEGTGALAYDSSGNGNTGNITGAIWVPGKIGNALQFDGTDDYVDAGENTILDSTAPMTVEAWVYQDCMGYDCPFGSIVSKMDRYNNGWNLFISENEYWFEMYSGGVWKITGHNTRGYGNGGEYTHHLAGVFNGTHIELYVDGTPSNWYPVTQTPSAAVTNHLYIGNAENRGPFTGTIDEVRVYNRALSPEEILAHYKTTGVANTSSFRFVAWADTKRGTSTLTAESIAVNSLNPAFTIYPGDLIDCTSSNNPGCFSNGFNTWKTAFNGGGTNNLFAKSFLTRGNHDAKSDTVWLPNFDFAAVASSVGATNYANQTEDMTYSFDYGNSHFVGIDLPSGSVLGISSAQMTWLDNDLTAAESRGLTHAFLFWHGPVYTLDGHCCEIASPALITVLNNHSIISAGFFGHEHVVAYTHMNSSRISGITHEFEEFVSGDAGAGPNTIKSGRADGWLRSDGIWANSGSLSTAHGFVSVDVNGNNYTVSIHTINGTVAKTFSFSNGNNGNISALTTTSCTNNIKDGDETGIDCGGSCPVCQDTIVPPATAPLKPVSKKPVAYWKFDEGTGTTTRDSSGSGYKATLKNGPKWVPGRFGSAIKFDGINDYVDAKNSFDLGTGNWTISFWISQEKASGSRTAVAKGSSGGSGDLLIYDLNDASKGYMVFRNDQNTGAKIINIGASTLAGTGFRFVAVTRNENTIKTYLDGKLYKTETIKSNYKFSNSHRWTFGAREDGKQAYLKGTLDEIKIYKQALSADEIMAEYAQ